RRRAHRRREETVAEVPETAISDDDRSPEQVAAQRQARARLGAALDGMDLEKRAIFVMFELDEVSGEEIAEILGVPLGTVDSRFHAAGKAFRRALARLDARAASRRARRCAPACWGSRASGGRR